MKKRVASFIVAFLLLALLVFPAQAGLIWCQGDPVVQLNGTNVQVVVSIPDTQQQLVTGPIEVDIATPNSVSRQMISTDSGFNGYGEDVSFSDLNAKPLGRFFFTRITAHIPVSSGVSDIPVEMSVTPANGMTVTVKGTANQTTATLPIAGS